MIGPDVPRDASAPLDEVGRASIGAWGFGASLLLAISGWRLAVLTGPWLW